MGREIERKFLVRSDGWRNEAVRSVGIRQAYLAGTPKLTVRIRLRDDNTAALTIKNGERGIERAEYEYEIPVEDAEELIGLAQSQVIEKRRHEVPAGDLTWEVDVFGGSHEGLVLAEIELDAAAQEVPIPDWVGEEVTGDSRYANAALAGLQLLD